MNSLTALTRRHTSSLRGNNKRAVALYTLILYERKDFAISHIRLIRAKKRIVRRNALGRKKVFEFRSVASWAYKTSLVVITLFYLYSVSVSARYRVVAFCPIGTQLIS